MGIFRKLLGIYYIYIGTNGVPGENYSDHILTETASLVLVDLSRL